MNIVRLFVKYGKDPVKMVSDKIIALEKKGETFKFPELPKGSRTRSTNRIKWQ